MMFQEGQRTYVIAEIGANHNGDIDLARKMIETAKEIGCDCVKFQSWDTRIFSRQVYDQNFFLGDDYRKRSDYTLQEIVDEFAVSADELAKLKAFCDEIEIDFASTPFEHDQVDLLVRVNAPFIKIASMDLNNDHLLGYAAQTGKTIVLSTGFGTLAEIDHAVRTIEQANNRNIVILHCVSLYPPKDSQVNLNNLETLQRTFGYPVGFSDHTLGTEISLAAIAKRAVVLEKHFTLDKEMPGWDHRISADPAEMAAIVRGAHRIHAALGSKRRQLSSEEEERKLAYRRSIVAARDIKAGETIDESAVTFRRPGIGIEPNMVPYLLGLVALRDIEADTVLKMSDLTAPRTGGV
ncbi:MAG: N-acetylneuraminate synthase family protein [Alphaproteobacteria bacterium]|nr:N-acetylneuraminate synthase family protein [Alphaproteobacteria bacterium]